jgi:Arc/MetJ family transcription regulator
MGASPPDFILPPNPDKVLYAKLSKTGVISDMSRTNIEIDDDLMAKARRLTGLKTKRQIVDKALHLLVRSESRKGILRYYGSGIWKGDVKSSRRNRV